MRKRIHAFGKCINASRALRHYLPTAGERLQRTDQTPKMPTPEKKKAYQDGGQFYAEGTGKQIADYWFMIHSDHDTAGAEMARQTFIRAHGETYSL